MNQPEQQTPEQPSPEVKLPTDKVTVLNVDDIKPNSILVINVDVESPVHKMAVAPVFSKLLAPYTRKLQEKKVTVMLMTLNESINTVTEEEMNRAGWHKKEESLIIKPTGY